jgi:hypothetical protein
MGYKNVPEVKQSAKNLVPFPHRSLQSEDDSPKARFRWCLNQMKEGLSLLLALAIVSYAIAQPYVKESVLFSLRSLNLIPQ